VVEAELEYILRDHDDHLLAFREQMMKHIAALLNERYGEGTVVADVRRQYANMKEMIEPHFHLIENARKAVEAAGMQPISPAIRGGTDGATLSFMGLPCPNLGTGGYAFHGPYEHITVEGMDKAVEILLGIVRLFK